MPIFVCGINHKTAAVTLREKVIFPLDKLGLYLNDLQANENITEAVILSTCNRSELYCNSNDAERMLAWFARQHTVSERELTEAMYCYEDQAAITHLLSVACGIDSMVLGESQILGQLKNAFSESCAAGMVDNLFNRLFQEVFAVAKEIRSNTAIGACPVSVSSSTVAFIKQNSAVPLAQANLLLIGAGATTELLLKHLQAQPVLSITIINRNMENALALAQRFPIQVLPFTELPFALKTADIAITATNSAIPLVTKEMLSDRFKPIFIVDIAVPRDVEPGAASLNQVNLHSIDDLKSIIHNNMRGREHAAVKAREIIAQRSQQFVLWSKSLDLVTSTIRSYREHIESLCQSELTKSLRQLQRGIDPEAVLTQFAYALTQKWLHTPSVQLRQAGSAGRLDVLQLAQELFALPVTERL
jgi:glutamyl-tRNA reductase